MSDINDTPDRSGRTGSRIGAGLFLLLVGGILLADQLGVPLPQWLFGWHALLIAMGLFAGIRHRFRGGAWFILILVGGFFLLQDYYPQVPFKRYLWPVVIMFVGCMIIFGPRRTRWRRQWEKNLGDGPATEGLDTKYGYYSGQEWKKKYGQAFSSSRESYNSEDFVDSTAIFGGVHKKIVSKNFKGGDITTVMGGTELDFTQADFTGTVRLDITQVMGGTKLIVPSHWEVRSEVSSIFAGFEDKRQQPAVHNPEKVLILEGTCVFAGIELKNY